MLERNRLNRKKMSAANGFILVEASPLPGWLQPLRAGPCGAANPLKSLPSELAQTKAENEKNMAAANGFISAEGSPTRDACGRRVRGRAI